MIAPIRPAFYARVSSQRQANERTIESQCEVLRQQVKLDGFCLEPTCEFLDDGCSGTELLRPALEKLRDCIVSGVVNRLYIYSVDRLARKMGHQLLLLDEFKRYACEVIFIDQPTRDDSPESNMLLNIQGVLAEYEREKILERTRRGRKHSASKGNLSVFSGAPYGYRYITKAEGGGHASWVIDEIKSEHVKLMFDLVGNQGCSLREVCRELERRSIPTTTGNKSWRITTIRAMLINDAYHGTARFGKTRITPRIPGKRSIRGAPEIPRCPTSRAGTEAAEQIEIRVPGFIDQELFERVKVTMDENKRVKRERCEGTKYLLSGKVVCGCCQTAYCASRYSKDGYYYRCQANDPRRALNNIACKNKSVVGKKLESEVWAQLCVLLRDPNRIRDEHDRREHEPQYASRKQKLEKELITIQSRLDRLIDVFEEGALERTEFLKRTSFLRTTKERLSYDLRQLGQLQHLAQNYESAEHTLATLLEQVQTGLESANWELQRTLVKLLVKQIEVHETEIRIVFKVPPVPFFLPPGDRDTRGGLRHCTSRQTRTGAVCPRGNDPSF
jgi:site-specific DNA recombinase